MWNPVGWSRLQVFLVWNAVSESEEGYIHGWLGVGPSTESTTKGRRSALGSSVANARLFLLEKIQKCCSTHQRILKKADRKAVGSDGPPAPWCGRINNGPIRVTTSSNGRRGNSTLAVPMAPHRSPNETDERDNWRALPALPLRYNEAPTPIDVATAGFQLNRSFGPYIIFLLL